ncbi:hypothetical protein [Nonomuraea lactucae]|uniref:hypothetical protein n=1 Tax=Nonomuraea lactucae TaxID=2249762 RepID=UPI0013B3B38E|nr:hypothetical protein [Nonomuraea lactucae]
MTLPGVPGSADRITAYEDWVVGEEGLEASLDRMAGPGWVSVPAFSSWETFEQVARSWGSGRFRESFRAAHARLGPLVSAAYHGRIIR